MKNLILILSAVFLLTGCANNMKQPEDTSSQTNMELETEGQMEKGANKIQAVTNDETVETKDKLISNPQAPDTSSLKEIGQRYVDANGSVTLEAISDYQDTHLIGPIELTIQDVKALNFSPALHLIDYYHGFTHNEMNFNMVEFSIIVKNTSEEAVNFAPVSVLETNHGELKDFEDDIYLQNLHGILAGNQEKTGKLAFILEEMNPKNITSITITTSDVFGEDNNSLYEGQKVEIGFE